MKAKKMLGTLGVIAGIGFGFVTINQPTMAHASYYSWTKTKAYPTPVAFHQKSRGTTAYMWDAHHTRKLHNLKNYPRTTWYLSQSVKMRGNIYYHVTSGNGKTTGYVWRGYLSKGVSPYAVSATTTTTGTTTSTTSGTSTATQTTSGTTTTTPTISSNIISADTLTTYSNTTAAEQKQQDTEILSLFKGTYYNSQLEYVANLLAVRDTEGSDASDAYDRNAYSKLTATQNANKKIITDGSNLALTQELNSGKISFIDYVKASLTKQGIDPTSYSNWQIGAGSFAKSDQGDFSGYGDFTIILVPAS